VAHSAQREVEILHDQLLKLFAHPPGGRPLNPRDVVVMVPDIDLFAPAIRAVFGQLPRDDARFIPYGISDLQERGHDALLVALELAGWVRLGQQAKVVMGVLAGAVTSRAP
jgi:exodeoxyribonuclease V gamma subunit